MQRLYIHCVVGWALPTITSMYQLQGFRLNFVHLLVGQAEIDGSGWFVRSSALARTQHYYEPIKTILTDYYLDDQFQTCGYDFLW